MHNLAPIVALSLTACRPGVRVDSSCTDAETAFLLETADTAENVLRALNDSGESLLDDYFSELYPEDVDLSAARSLQLLNRTRISCMDGDEFDAIAPPEHPGAIAMWARRSNRMIWNRTHMDLRFDRIEAAEDLEVTDVLADIDELFVTDYGSDCSAFWQDTPDIFYNEYHPLKLYYQYVLMGDVQVMVHEWGHEDLPGHDGQDEVELNTDFLQSLGIEPGGGSDVFSCADATTSWGYTAGLVHYTEFMEPIFGASEFYQTCDDHSLGLGNTFYRMEGQCVMGTVLE